MNFSTKQVDLRMEEASSRVRSDMVLMLEFKMAEDDAGTEEGLDSAIAQIRKKGYAEKYRGRGEPVHLISMVFGKKERNLLGIRSEPL